MSEAVAVALIGLAGVVAGGAVMWYVAIRKTPKEISVLDSEETVNLTTALNNATDALIKRTAAAEVERKDFEQRIGGLEARQMERNRQIFMLEQTIAEQDHKIQEQEQKLEAFNRDWAKEMSSVKRQIRDWYSNLKAWLDEKGLTDYPEPPPGLLDTGEHKAVK